MLDETGDKPTTPLSSLAGGYQLSVKNEDRYQILEAAISGEQICFMLLADGHGGKKTADLASSTLRTIASTATGPSKMELHDAAVAAFKGKQFLAARVFQLDELYAHYLEQTSEDDTPPTRL